MWFAIISKSIDTLLKIKSMNLLILRMKEKERKKPTHMAKHRKMGDLNKMNERHKSKSEV